MKSLSLTEDQKYKLLEMCIKSFPEYRFSFYHPLSKSYMLVGFLVDNDSDVYDNADIFIHWYELCVLYLVDKVVKYEQTGYESDSHGDSILRIAVKTEDYSNDPKWIDHPVDYLYYNFLKTKK